MRSRFITLEGGEGAGKSTQARLLASALAAAGLPVLRTREPGGAPGAEAIRALLLGRGDWDGLTETMLHFAARREHVARTIRPALAAGIWVVCDRFADSTLAYQCAGQGVSRAVWDRLVELALEGLRPDLTLLLDVPAAVGLARVGASGRPGGLDRYERLGLGFHERIGEAFRTMAAAEPGRWAVVDATLPPSGVREAVLEAVEARLLAGTPTPTLPRNREREKWLPSAACGHGVFRPAGTTP